jgi:hypothetical protein
VIINSPITASLKGTPTLNGDWQEQLRSWLAIIVGVDFPPVFFTQLEMLDSVIAIEREIQKTRMQAGNLKKLIPQFKLTNELPRIIDTQREISELERKIQSLQYQRETVLFLGDVMALKLLDQDTIKHFGGYPSPGFISGKSGLKAEQDAAKRFFAEGYMVLFNDLTHSLPLGDLTLRKGEEVRTFEVKSNPREYFSKEAFRQIGTPIVIHDYMKNDVTRVPVNLPDKTFQEAGFDPGSKKAAYAIQLDSKIVEKLHFDIAGTVFKGVYREPVVQIIRGAKHYLACRTRNVPALRSKLEEITRSGDWIVSDIRQRVREYGDVPPFGLYFKPDSTVDVITGEVVIVSVFSMQDLAEQLNSKKITLNWERKFSDLFSMDFKPDYPLDGKLEIQTKNICRWHWLRVLYSFLSLETFVERCAEVLSPEEIAKFEAKIEEIHKAKSP